MKWQELRVGDIVHLSNNETVPADILLLRTSDPQGVCYIDTCDLDGETNLKRREVSSQHLANPVALRDSTDICHFFAGCTWLRGDAEHFCAQQVC